MNKIDIDIDIVIEYIDWKKISKEKKITRRFH